MFELLTNAEFGRSQKESEFNRFRLMLKQYPYAVTIIINHAKEALNKERISPDHLKELQELVQNRL